LAAECLRQADGPPSLGREWRAPARVTLSARAAEFPLFKMAMLGLQVDPILYLRQMEPEHLLPLPEGAPSRPQRNGRHAPAPPKLQLAFGHALLRHRCPPATLVLRSRAEILGRGTRLWSLGSA